MPATKQKPFSQLVEKFKKTMQDRSVKPRLILIVMANTHDATLQIACSKDAKSVRKAFSNICKHIHFDFSAIEISGDNYDRKNLIKAVDVITLHTEAIIVFYYSGHGFSYEKDRRRKYPQIDLRAHNDQPRYNKISFIDQYTENLAVILNMIRFKGARINIAIGDCCNSTVPFKRPVNSEKDMNIVKGIMPYTGKALTRKVFSDEKNAVSILVSASTYGESAVSDDDIGSIFTHHFTRSLEDVISNEAEGDQYLPWVRLLKKTAKQAFKDSQTYGVEEGKVGKQNAVFEVFIAEE